MEFFIVLNFLCKKVKRAVGNLLAKLCNEKSAKVTKP